MVPRLLKWSGILLSGLLLLAAVLVGVLNGIANTRLAREYDVQPEPVVVPADEASIEQGRKWAAVLCADCHGEDLSGRPLLDDAAIGFIPSPNLTPGHGGVGNVYTDDDWVLALRAGVDPQDGTALFGMPSMNFYYLSDEDLGALMAYLKTLPPVDHEMGTTKLSLMGKVLMAGGGFGKNILPAEILADAVPRPEAVTAAESVEYGDYLVRISGCRDCHGEDLQGGKSPEPGAPHAPDITSGGVLGAWTQETFIASARTRQGEAMPWVVLKPLSDPELRAMFLYLQSLPAR